jgi:hypothetical protein
MILADGFAVEFDRLSRQRVGNGLARRAGNDVVPDFSQIGVFPEIGLEGILRHAVLPVFAILFLSSGFCRLVSAALFLLPCGICYMV